MNPEPIQNANRGAVVAAASDTYHAPRYVWIPALVFTSILILFLITAFFVAPNLTNDRREIIQFLYPLLAGFATFFLGGTALLEVSGETSRGKKLGLSATAGVAVFALCYLYPPHFIAKRAELRADQKAALERLSGLIAVMRWEAKTFADNYPEQYHARVASGEQPDIVKHDLFMASDKRIDQDAHCASVQNAVATAFPQKTAAEWRQFFRGVQHRYVEFQEKVHQAAVATNSAAMDTEIEEARLAALEELEKAHNDCVAELVR